MGYESKLFIVDKKHNCYRKDDGKVWGELIASYDMCVFPPFNDVFVQPTNCYIYLDNGGNKENSEQEVKEDKYGKPLTEASLKDVISCLENLNEEDRKYRRVAPLLALLRSFQQELDEGNPWEELTVLHYGH
jgi:hypothetical protein